MSRRPLTALALAAALAGGCATTTPWVSPEEHQRLARQQLELERRAAQAELEIERLKRRVAELESGGTVAPAGRAVAAPPAPRAAALDEAPVPGWRAPGGNVEESELAELETAARGAANRDGASAYERGLVLLRDGDPVAAETELRAFLDAGASPDLGDNAWFWIGESRLARGDAAGAIAAYRQCLELYPEGNKVPDAMLKLGQAFSATGDPGSAREVWSELVRRFPATAAAESARSRLAIP
jgi:tol-pal system protein YbgF